MPDTPLRATRDQIAEFLTHRRIAAIGLSRNSKDFTRMLSSEFKKKGYEVVPVNPAASEIDGERCFGRIQDVQPPVEAALVLTTSAASEQVVRDCAEAGVSRVWLYGTGNLKTVNQKAVEFCREHRIEVIPGECPYMFIGSWPHKIHGLVNKIVGAYPR